MVRAFGIYPLSPSASAGGEGWGEGAFEHANRLAPPSGSPSPWPSPHSRGEGKVKSGFTLIELLVVLAIIALLATIALPRYFQSIDTAKETVLAENLRNTRETIDKFYSDTARYPDSLDELVDKKYLRALPVDPLTESATTWTLLPPEEGFKGKVRDLRSGAPGNGRNGKPYAEW